MEEEQEPIENEAQRKSSAYYSVGLNPELIVAIIGFSITFIWLILSLFLIHRFYLINLVIFLVSVLCLVIGLYKRNKIKNNDLDF